MKILEKIQPKNVMHWFEEISSIPRGSLKEEKLSAYIMEFAHQRGLACSEDAYHNVLVRKPATPGREDRDTLVLQSHMDMICAKDEDVEHDFENEGLSLYVDGDQIRARGTTLGADNGIGVAYQLAILDDNSFEHPAIEAVFTTAEEIGMIGAIHFDMTKLTGRRMINFDAGGFTEGRIYVGCAGNQHAKLIQQLAYEPYRAGEEPVCLTINGLHGGHSGGDIVKGRGNGSVLMGRLLSMLLTQAQAKIAGFESGDVSQENKNGIPAACTVVACVPDREKLNHLARQFNAMIRDELSDVDDEVCLTVTEGKTDIQRVLTEESAFMTAQLLAILPNGVQSMQRLFPDTPECSCNIGNVEINDEAASYYLSIRGSKASLIEHICEKYAAIAKLTDSKLILENRLPSWDYDKNSRLRVLVDQEYRKEFGCAPRFKVTHASTECSMFKVHNPQMDIISMGPIIYEEHTTKEYMGIESVGILWEFVKNIISQL
ncbi:MAG: aminoacyl-histidine dipeptidase [Clostridiales bacterium]|nr:aminoacyl-histidine dipeptidase [Clostridiales bacterium]